MLAEREPSMPRGKVIYALVTFLLSSLLSTSVCFGDNQTLKPIREWRGSVADETLLNDASTIITSTTELQKLWTSWKIKGKRPKIDFTRQLAAIVTSRGSGLNMMTSLEADGNLKVNGFGTMDLRPGFRYVISTFNREGIKSVNGKPLTGENAQSTVTGTVSYRQRIALPPTATVEVVLADVSRADAPAVEIGKQVIKPTTQVPIAFSLSYDPAKIDSTHTYAVRASIMLDGKLWFSTTERYAVITQGNPTKVDILVQMVKSTP